jgi:pyruvate/2-oxoglutarate dehydrogenase complex dihydrolipoamide dehydrogenase (E3) component
MLVQSATHEAEVAAENAVLDGRRTLRHAVVPHGGFTDPEYGSVGFTEEEARREHDCTVAVVPYTDLDRGIIDGRPEGSCKLIVSRETRRVLGAHIVGEQAVEVVQLAATAMRAGMRVEQLADLELAYPTFTAAVGLAARRITRALGFIPLARAERDGNEQLRAAEWELRSG